MKPRRNVVLVSLVLLFLVGTLIPSAEAGDGNGFALRREVERLRERVNVLEKEVLELKAAIGTKVRVAVLPANLGGEGREYEAVLVEALHRVFQGTERFVPAYSYYALPKEFGARPLPPGLTEAGVWKRRSFWNPYEPDLKRIERIGKRLNVDGVLLYSLVIPGNDTDRIEVFLVDVKTGKVYHHKQVTPIKNILMGNLFIKTNEIKGITDQVFWEYLKDHRP